MSETPDDNNCSKRPRKKYKAYLDNSSDGQPIVSRRTSNRWKLREKTGLQFATRAPDQRTEKDAETTEVPRSSLLAKHQETSTDYFELPIESGRDNDRDFDDDDDHGSDEEGCNDFDVSCSDNSSVSSDHCSSRVHLGGNNFVSDSDEEEANHADNFDGDDNGDKAYYENWLMFESSNVSVWEVFNMVQAMSVRFKFSEEAQQSVLEFAKILAGPKFRNLNTTKYTMGKIYNPPDDKKAYVFFCPTCSTILHEPIKKQNMTDKESAVCDDCSKNYLMSRSMNNYFMTIDVAYQIRTILKNSKVQCAINNNVEIIRNQSRDENIISDIYSSSRYKNCDYITKTQSKNVIVLTLNVNIDGGALFNTSKNSLWPIQAIINEIPAKFRYRFFILAALWVTSAEPKPSLMNIYIKFFIKQVLNMMEKGITITNDQGETFTYFVKNFCFPVDTPARAILQNRTQFNGYYGCSWCYALGVYTERAMKYPLTMEDADDRSHDEYLKDIETFENCTRHMRKPLEFKKQEIKRIIRLSRGSKGPSELISLRTFDCVWGFSGEYLHSVLLGAVKQQWEEWVNPKRGFCLTPLQRDIIDERLISIQPPNEIHRLPRLLKDRAKWRGSEWKSWLLYYSVPCLIDILPDGLLKSYMLLVRATNILLRTDITPQNLNQCEIDLIQYVGDSQNDYGESFITFNIHSLLHLAESVRQNGPLWATSAFPFESQIGQLKKVVTGPKGVIDQISNRMLQSNTFKTLVSAMSSDKETWKFCKSVYDHRPVLKHCHRTKEGAVLAGIVRSKQSEIEMKFNRCIYKNVMFHSTSYTRPKKINNRIVELIDGTILEVQYFSVIDDTCHVVGRKWNTSSMKRGTELSHIRIVNSIHDNNMMVPITEVKQKLVCLVIHKVQGVAGDMHLDTVDPDLYICILPNTVEVQ